MRSLPLIISTLLTALALIAPAADFYTPVSITSPNSEAFFPIDRLHQGPGIGFSASPPHDGFPGQTWVTSAPGGYPSDYLAFRPPPILLIDLGTDRFLTEISTWGYNTANDNGLKTFSLRFATNAEGPTGFSRSIPSQGPFSALKSDITRDSRPLTPLTARYVEFTCTDNYFTGTGTTGGDRVGLGEIAFAFTPPPITVKLEASPSLVDFGNFPTQPGIVTRSVTIRNTGSSIPLTLTNPVITGPGAARFSLTSFPPSLTPGSSGTINLSFNPANLDGCWSAQLLLNSNDPARPVLNIGLLASVNCTPAPPEPVAFSQPAGTFTGSLSLSLTSPTPGAVILFTTDGSLPAPDSAQLYTAPLQLSASTMVRAVASLAGKLSPPASSGYLRLSSALASRTSPLPILIIDNFNAGTIPDKGWTTNNQTGAGLRQRALQPALFLLFDRNPSSNRASILGPASTATRAGLRVRGAFSSTWFPKPYALETWDDLNNDRHLPILGMPSESDWVLYHPHPSYDTTMIFNTFIWDLSRLTGRYAPRYRFIEVFVNENGGDLDVSDRRGLYALVEEVKRDNSRLDFEPLSPDGSSGGWLHSYNRMDATPINGFPAPNGATSPQFFRTAGPNRILQTSPNNPTQSGDDIPRQSNCFINFDDPGGYEISPTQRAAIEAWYVQFENALYDNTRWRDPANGYRRFLDTRDFIDYFQLLNLARQGDGLLLSMYPWVSSSDRRLRMGPMWDFNNGAYHLSGTPTTTLYFRQSELWYPRLFADPDFLNEYIDRWFDLRRGPLSNTAMQAIVDSQAAAITAEIANAQGVSSASWSSGLTSMKSFLVQRATWIDSQYVLPPVFSATPGLQPAPFNLSLSNTSGLAGTIYYTTDGSDPRSTTNTAIGRLYSSPIPIGSSTRVKARTLTTTNRWSGLNDAVFNLGTPASSANLVISEIHYNPPGPDDSGEFLELLNISSQPIDLSSARFESGIQFTFPIGTSLAPGEYAIIAARAADFPSPPPRILGEFANSSRLDNGGESLRLLAADNSLISEFSWDDTPPWPQSPDGNGPSLTLIRPLTKPDPANPANWRPSTNPGGSPGTSDAITFSGNPLADDNFDGFPNLAAHALGLNLPAQGPYLPSLSLTNNRLTWAFPSNPAAEDVTITPEVSSNLTSWSPASSFFPDSSSSEPTDGRSWTTLLSPSPPPPGTHYFRLRISPR
jgi:hypothetical protein